MPMPGAEYKPAFLTDGERDVLMKALQFYTHEQQCLITRMWEKYVKPYVGSPNTKSAKFARATFEDHKRHHQNMIDAASALHERFRLGGYRVNPNATKEQSNGQA